MDLLLRLVQVIMYTNRARHFMESVYDIIYSVLDETFKLLPSSPRAFRDSEPGGLRGAGGGVYHRRVHRRIHRALRPVPQPPQLPVLPKYP